MHYTVVESSDLQDLISQVNSHLADGWEPQGGVAVVYSPVSGSWYFYQALAAQTADDNEV